MRVQPTVRGREGRGGGRGRRVQMEVGGGGGMVARSVVPL